MGGIYRPPTDTNPVSCTVFEILSLKYFGNRHSRLSSELILSRSALMTCSSVLSHFGPQVILVFFRGVNWCSPFCLSVIGYEDRLWNDLDCVGWDVKVYSKCLFANQNGCHSSCRRWFCMFSSVQDDAWTATNTSQTSIQHDSILETSEQLTTLFPRLSPVIDALLTASIWAVSADNKAFSTSTTNLLIDCTQTP